MLTPDLSNFLTACLDPQATLRDAMARQNVSPATLAAWLRSPQFCRHLRRLQASLHKRRDLGLLLASQHAADTLEQLAAGALKPAAQQRQACVDLIRLARITPRRKAAAAASVRPQLIHQDVDDHEVSQLLQQLTPNEPPGHGT